MSDFDLNKYRMKWEQQEQDLDREETWLYVKTFVGGIVLIGLLAGLAVLMFAA